MRIMRRLAPAFFLIAVALAATPLCPAQDDDAPKTLKACMLQLRALDFSQENYVQTFTNADGSIQTFTTKLTSTVQWTGGSAFTTSWSRLNNGKHYMTVVNHLDVADLDLDDATVKHVIANPLPPGRTVTSGIHLNEYWDVLIPLLPGKTFTRDVTDDSSGQTKTSTPQLSDYQEGFSTEHAAHDCIRLLRLARKFVGSEIVPLPASASPAQGSPTPPSRTEPTSRADSPPTPISRAWLQQMQGVEWRHDTYSMSKDPDLSMTTKLDWTIDEHGPGAVDFSNTVHVDVAAGPTDTIDRWTVALADLDPDLISVEHAELPDPQGNGWKISSGSWPVDVWVVTLRTRGEKPSIAQATTQTSDGQTKTTNYHVAALRITFESDQAAQNFKKLMRAGLAGK